jgi:TPR repeat protein
MLLLMLCVLCGNRCQAQNRIETLRQQAAHGDSAALMRLSEAYRFGNHGATVKPDSANHYLRLAAKQGIADAHYLLGIAYFRGLGLERDARQGLKQLEQAAQGDHKLALQVLIKAHAQPFTRFGRSPFPVDSARALTYALQAARLGVTDGMRFAGLAYHRGSGNIQRDDSLAIHWLSTAAVKHQDPEAQQILGDWFFQARTRYGLQLARARRFYKLLQNNPNASLEQSTEGEVGYYNTGKFQRRAVNLHLLLGTLTPEAAPQLSIRP